MEWNNVHSEAVARRLFAKLQPTLLGCFEWTGGRNDKGYGKLRSGDKIIYVHRMIVELKEKRILSPYELVMHKCDNPPCCNPEHLIVGDLAANMADMVSKGRAAYGERNGRSGLCVAQVMRIKMALNYHQGIGHLALRFKVSKRTIQDIRDRRTWQHVEIPDRQALQRSLLEAA